MQKKEEKTTSPHGFYNTMGSERVKILVREAAAVCILSKEYGRLIKGGKQLKHPISTHTRT